MPLMQESFANFVISIDIKVSDLGGCSWSKKIEKRPKIKNLTFPRAIISEQIFPRTLFFGYLIYEKLQKKVKNHTYKRF